LSRNAAFKPKEKLDAYTGWTGHVETLKSLDCNDAVRILESERSILAWAVMNMHIEFVKTLLAFNGIRANLFFETVVVSPVNAIHYAVVNPGHGYKPLHFAAVNGDTEMIRLLVRSGAMVGTLAEGFPRPEAINLAAEPPASSDTVKTLVKLGANIKPAWADRIVMDPVLRQYTVSWPLNVTTIAYLYATCGPRTYGKALWDVLIYMAAARGDDEVVRWLQHAGANVDDLYGHSDGLPMQVAAMNGQLEVIKYLHKVGESLSSDMEIYGRKTGRTPLRLAVEGGHVSVVRYLASQKDVSVHDPSKDDTCEYAPIHYAAVTNQAEVIKVLVEEFGVDADKRLTWRHRLNCTPLHIAAQGNHVQASRQLVKCGAKLDAVDEYGKRATDLARRAGHKALAKELKPGHNWNPIKWWG
jgi:ankyrin repeat protein